MKPTAFTVQADGLARELESQVNIRRYDPKISLSNSIFKPYKAIWDTGATATVITQKVVDELQLPVMGYARCQTVGNTIDTTSHYVSLLLPNHVVVNLVSVTVGNVTNADVLIGMDIINLGDFAVSNFQGKTTFTFRYPSIARIDFVSEASTTYGHPTPEKKKSSPESLRYPGVGRKKPCPCKSGKRHGRCCWDKPPEASPPA